MQDYAALIPDVQKAIQDTTPRADALLGIAGVANECAGFQATCQM